MQVYKKIDFIFAGDYICTTSQSKTCKQAKKKYLDSIEMRKHSIGGIGLVESRILKYPELLKVRFQ